MIKRGKALKFSQKVEDTESTVYIDEKVPYFVEETIDTNIGYVRRVGTKLKKKDILDGWKVRWGINRNKYSISPGLYAIGNPNESSHVLVTANYKLTFDKLRKELKDLDIWIVVLDTKGVNVWCASGKGTFGTKEIINRIKKLQLNKLVCHNTIILPQLGAPGVAAHIVTRITGFKVVYGPIYAKDIPAFLKEGLEATKEMREVKFNFMDRLVLTPIEIMNSLKYIISIFSVLLIINSINPGVINIYKIIKYAAFNSIPFIISVFIGCFVVPVLLPFIPFRAFSLKGLSLGTIWSVICIFFSKIFLFPNNIIIYLANSLIICSITTFLSLNFTGSTTYTSLSGVEKETRITFPKVIFSCIIGVLLLIIYKLLLFF